MAVWAIDSLAGGCHRRSKIGGVDDESFTVTNIVNDIGHAEKIIQSPKNRDGAEVLRGRRC